MKNTVIDIDRSNSSSAITAVPPDTDAPSAPQAVAVAVGTRILRKNDFCRTFEPGAVFAVYPPSTDNYSGGASSEPLYFDAIFESGRKSMALCVGDVAGKDVPDGWMEFKWGEGTTTKAEVKKLLARPTRKAAKEALQRARARTAFEQEMAEAREEGIQMGLIPESEFKGPGKALVWNLRKHLETIGIKASVVFDTKEEEVNVYLTELHVRRTESDEEDDADAGVLFSVEDAVRATYRYRGPTESNRGHMRWNPTAWGEVFGSAPVNVHLWGASQRY